MIRIISLTDRGRSLADVLANRLKDCETHHCPKPFGETVQSYFKQNDDLIFVCATGIVIRTLAPVLESKLADPAVLVMDELGHFVIPLLSGHEGGANQLANNVASLLADLNTQLVMTTANAYLDPIYTLGMGCERNCPLTFLEDLMLEALAAKGLKPTDIQSLCSIDIKSDETNLIALAHKYGWTFTTYSVDELTTMTPLLSTHSEYVYKTVGVYGVAESAALYAAQQATSVKPELLLPKIKNAKATCALARAYSNNTEKVGKV
ncbi:cobalamin biosynthesis protein CbiG [Marinomonas mediterranea]|uniref:cobalamin biosynthesis protein n=1 Tax=Marinomonas mediterranea TaxID=119864 RepID=UPI002349E82D|nr:cobalamin biosynthesis protein [Marinomonas mediterranea]WCN12622.1 cobalamin biosynthesis protein CbiG [Marinomonas mediterranea]